MNPHTCGVACHDAQWGIQACTRTHGHDGLHQAKTAKGPFVWGVRQ